MTDLSDAMAAPFTECIGGVTYECAPLDMGDWGALERHMREQIVRVGIEQMAHAETPGDKTLILDRAYMMAGKLSIAITDVSDSDISTASMRILNGPECCLMVLWLSLQHKHPGLTWAKVVELSRIHGRPKTVQLVDKIIHYSLSPSTGEDGAKKNEAEK